MIRGFSRAVHAKRSEMQAIDKSIHQYATGVAFEYAVWMSNFLQFFHAQNARQCRFSVEQFRKITFTPAMFGLIVLALLGT